MKNTIISFFIVLIIILIFSCSSNPRQKHHISGVEELFYKKQYSQALSLLKNRTSKISKRNHLLYLIETGTLLYSTGEYEKSKSIFLQAEAICNSIKKTTSKAIAAFFINDKKQNFIGESYERVMVKFYLALSYIKLEEREKALRTLRRMNIELEQISYFEENYRQNYAARYLCAILAQELSNENLARVQYNNMKKSTHANIVDIAKLELSYINNEKPKENYLSINHSNDFQTVNTLGSLVIIHQVGKAPIKMSRGKLGDQSEVKLLFQESVKVAYIAALVNFPNIAYSAASLSIILSFLYRSENPIPIYFRRTKSTYQNQPSLFVINDTYTHKLNLMDSYSDMTLVNYNQNYPKILKKNIQSISTKAVLAFLGAQSAGALTKNIVKSQGGDNNTATFLSGFTKLITASIAGKAIQSTTKPDLRCWRLNYDHLEMKRIYLQEGTYSFKFLNQKDTQFTTDLPNQIKIKSGKTTFVMMRSI